MTKYYLDEENVLWSLNALKEEYHRLLNEDAIDEQYADCQCWIYDRVHNACTLNEVEISEYDEQHKEAVIELALVDSKELPAVLDSLIKQELYKWMGKVDEPEAHVKAEITRIEQKKACLKDLLKAYQAMIPVGTKLYNAVNGCEDMENQGKIQQLYVDYERKMVSCGVMLIDVIREIIPKNIDMDSVYTEWFETTDENNENYIEALIAWCDTPIILEAYEHLF